MRPWYRDPLLVVCAAVGTPLVAGIIFMTYFMVVSTILQMVGR